MTKAQKTNGAELSGDGGLVNTRRCSSLLLFCFWFSVGLSHLCCLPCRDALWVGPGHGFILPAIPTLPTLPPAAPTTACQSSVFMSNNEPSLQKCWGGEMHPFKSWCVPDTACLSPPRSVCRLLKWRCQQVGWVGLATWKRPFPDYSLIPFCSLNLTPVMSAPLRTEPREILGVSVKASWFVCKRNPTP